MSITLPLEKMSAEEKIRVMESIWEDLCDTAASTITPDWHANLLAERKAALASGEDEVLDWQTAKNRISEDLQ